MKAEFLITVDVSRSLVRIAMAGFFSNDDIARFVEARDMAHRSLQCGPNQHLTLVDITKMDIQAQDSVDRFRSVLVNTETSSKRLAFVVARSLARMQIQRAANTRSAAYFTDACEAENWLCKTQHVTC